MIRSVELRAPLDLAASLPVTPQPNGSAFADVLSRHVDSPPDHAPDRTADRDRPQARGSRRDADDQIGEDGATQRALSEDDDADVRKVDNNNDEDAASLDDEAATADSDTSARDQDPSAQGETSQENHAHGSTIEEGADETAGVSLATAPVWAVPVTSSTSGPSSAASLETDVEPGTTFVSNSAVLNSGTQEATSDAPPSEQAHGQRPATPPVGGDTGLAASPAAAAHAPPTEADAPPVADTATAPAATDASDEAALSWAEPQLEPPTTSLPTLVADPTTVHVPSQQQTPMAAIRMHAAPPDAPLMAPQDAASPADDIARALDKLRPIPAGGATVAVELPELGTIRITVQPLEHGTRVTVQTQDPAATAALEHDRAGLVTAVSEATGDDPDGLQLDIHTGHKNGHDHGTHDAHESGAQAAAPTNRRLYATGAVEESAQRARISHDGLISELA